ncbi:Phosphate-import ATP-binding protein PhnC [subsurface metagenome]
MTFGIKIVDLAKSFDSKPVFSDLSLNVRRGEFVALVGPSGAGKTTLLRCLVRLLEADQGEIWVAGHAMHQIGAGKLAEARRDIGFVFQQFNLVRRRSARDNVVSGKLASMPLWRVVLGLFNPQDLRAAERALARVGLHDRSCLRADRLSGGQQQRVAIARALVQKSSVLLADEPIASLDPDSARGVLGLLRSVAHDDGMTVLCSLHQHELAHEYADRVVAIDDLKSPRWQ